MPTRSPDQHPDRPRGPLTKPDRFVWPPNNRAVEPLKPPPTPPQGRPEASGLLRTIEAVEETWVGVQSRSLGRRIQLAGWAPTPPWEACWRCGEPVGPHEADGDGCATCRKEPVPWSRFLSVGPYEGDLAQAIRELKFSGWRLVGRQMGALLGERIVAELAKYQIKGSNSVIVPVPSSWRSRVGRGVDHTAVIASAASRTSGVPLMKCLRRRHGPSQTSVAASERARNVRGVFSRSKRFEQTLPRFEPSFDLKSTSPGVVIVVDDIRTTGATLREAVKTVRGVKRSNQADGLGVDRVWAGSVAVVGGAERRVTAEFVAKTGLR